MTVEMFEHDGHDSGRAHAFALLARQPADADTPDGVLGTLQRLCRAAVVALSGFGSGLSLVAEDGVRGVATASDRADLAAIGLLQERAVRRGEILAEQLQGALNTRIVIEQAKGAVAQAQGVSVDEAFRLIRAFARRHNRWLSEVAQTIVTDPAGPSMLGSA
jgi:hypothetical protein